MSEEFILSLKIIGICAGIAYFSVFIYYLFSLIDI